jgi:Uma2 family endonuclease
MAATKVWTLEALHALPDDGNTYELVRGELLVTPAPTNHHENVAVLLARALEPYVAAHGLGYVYRPHAVIQRDGSQVEPDLMVRQIGTIDGSWDKAPDPILVVEILSRSSRKRDGDAKRAFYLDIGVAEYWIVDPAARAITSTRRGQPDTVAKEEIIWCPAGASAALGLKVPAIFCADARGG